MIHVNHKYLGKVDHLSTNPRSTYREYVTTFWWKSFPENDLPKIGSSLWFQRVMFEAFALSLSLSLFPILTMTSSSCSQLFGILTSNWPPCCWRHDGLQIILHASCSKRKHGFGTNPGQKPFPARWDDFWTWRSQENNMEKGWKRCTWLDRSMAVVKGTKFVQQTEHIQLLNFNSFSKWQSVTRFDQISQ